MSYVPPQLRNKQSVSFNEPLERHNPFGNARKTTRPVRTKPQWLIESEEAEKKTRSHEEETLKILEERTEEHFPSLGGNVARENVWSGGKKFSELAAEWKETDKPVEQVVEDKRSFVLPTFNNVRNFTDEIPRPSPLPVADDEWVEVKTKKYMKKPDDFKSIFDEEGNLLEEETVWNENEDDSCWNPEPMGKHKWD